MPHDVQHQAVQVGPAVTCGGSLRQRDPAIFSGTDEQDVEDWLTSYERVSLYNKWDDATKLNNVSFYLTGVANLWYRKHEVDIRTWSVFKTTFSEVFGLPAVRKLRAEQRLRERSQQVGESFTSYIEDVIDLCKRVNLNMSEADKIKHIFKGVDDDAFQMLVARDLSIVAEVVALCQSFEELRKQRLLTRQPPRQVESLSGLTPAPDTSSLLQQIKDFVREEVARQLFLLPNPTGQAADLAPALRHAIHEQVAEALPPAHPPPPVAAPLLYADVVAQTPPPMAAPLTYADVVARPRPPTYALPTTPTGHVSWRPVDTMSNPFLFFMQFALIVSTAEAGAVNTEFILAERLRQHGDCAKEKEFPNFALIVSTAEAGAVNTEFILAERLRQHGDCAKEKEFPNLSDCWGSPRATSSTSSTNHDIKALLPSSFFSGHVSWRPVDTMSNPFLFFMQVSSNVSTIKSNNMCLIQLTCPRRVLEVYFIGRDFVLSLLMLCGDIESNPGPPTEQLLTQLLEGQKDIQRRLGEIEAKLHKVEEFTSAINEFRDLSRELESRVAGLERKLVDLEDRGRRNNVIVFGIPEKLNETYEELSQSVLKGVFCDKMDTKVVSAERIHRIGRKQPNKHRPVIIKLMDHREKVNILKNCSKLKDTDYSISEDFSYTTRQIRKNLWESTAEIRKAGQKVKLIYNKIKIGDDLFVWDDTSKERVLEHGSRNRKQSDQ
ncbi:uncharacterized protein LOC144102811 [Amblyomma americanum]